MLVHVIGLPGAGKTTLTERLGRQLGWPVFSIGAFRQGRPPDARGEHQAWKALHLDLEARDFSKAVLETSGLNARVRRIEQEAPDDQLVRVKLECPQDLLHRRIRDRDGTDEPSDWAYSGTIPDRHAFIDRFFEVFEDLSAEIIVDTMDNDPSEVLETVLEELDDAR